MPINSFLFLPLHVSICLSVSKITLKNWQFVMKCFGGMWCVTCKNWLDHGADRACVMLKLWLQLPWQRFVLSECFCLHVAFFVVYRWPSQELEASLVYIKRQLPLLLSLYNCVYYNWFLFSAVVIKHVRLINKLAVFKEFTLEFQVIAENYS